MADDVGGVTVSPYLLCIIIGIIAWLKMTVVDTEFPCNLRIIWVIHWLKMRVVDNEGGRQGANFSFPYDRSALLEPCLSALIYYISIRLLTTGDELQTLLSTCLSPVPFLKTS